jgi:hypothetical protein
MTEWGRHRRPYERLPSLPTSVYCDGIALPVGVLSASILTALRTLDCEELQRAQIESFFGLQRGAALRLVDRQRLLEWLEGFEQDIDSCSRLCMVWKLERAQNSDQSALKRVTSDNTYYV